MTKNVQRSAIGCAICDGQEAKTEILARIGHGRRESGRTEGGVVSAIEGFELGSVQKTLLLPLWGRAVETRKPRPLLVDQTAVKIIDTIGYDFSTIARNISVISQLAWIVRSLHTDRTIRQFLARHPDATIVNLGCGLDTTFERVDNGRLCWYDLDLPDVIALRRRFIQESGRRRFFACSLLDTEWLRELKSVHSVFFVAMGVFYYLREGEMKLFLSRLADTFACSELLFDACSALGLKTANKKVIKDGGMDESAILRWSMERAKDQEAWDSRITVMAEYPLFRNMKGSLSLKEKWGTFLSDTLKIMSMVHLRLGSPKQGAITHPAAP
jgi:O-methyltransferase involved in polyketide biosynthesis